MAGWLPCRLFPMPSQADLTFNDAVTMAVRILSRRDHSETELRRKLAAAGVPPLLVSSVCDHCRQRDWLNEWRFAEMLIRSRARKGYGPRYIQAELRQHGFGQGDTAALWQQLEIDWLQVCRTALRKKSGRQSADAAIRRKLTHYLYQRGFDAELIRDALSSE